MTGQLEAGFFRSAVESSTDCVGVLDPEGRYLFINRAGLVGFEIDDRVPYEGMPYSAFLPETAGAEFDKGLDLARRGAIHRFEGARTTTLGVVTWWDVSIAPVDGVDGELAGFIVTARDITDVRQARAEVES